MSTILKRTIFYDDSQGWIVWAEWALVSTSLGTMLEPFCIDRLGVDTPIADADFSDDMCRIDEMRRIDITQFNWMVSDGDSPYCSGGYGIPRKGK